MNTFKDAFKGAVLQVVFGVFDVQCMLFPLGLQMSNYIRQDICTEF